MIFSFSGQTKIKERFECNQRASKEGWNVGTTKLHEEQAFYRGQISMLSFQVEWVKFVDDAYDMYLCDFNILVTVC